MLTPSKLVLMVTHLMVFGRFLMSISAEHRPYSGNLRVSLIVRAHTAVAPYMRAQPLPTTSFPFHYHPFIYCNILSYWQRC